jgi:hypothetical protein
MSSLMSSGRRSGPRSRRTWIRHVSESRSRSVGPRTRPWPKRSSPSCVVRRQLSRAGWQASNGMSTIRRNDRQPTAEPLSALGLPSAQLADEKAAVVAVVRGCRVLVSWPDPSDSDLFQGVRRHWTTSGLLVEGAEEEKPPAYSAPAQPGDCRRRSLGPLPQQMLARARLATWRRRYQAATEIGATPGSEQRYVQDGS